MTTILSFHKGRFHIQGVPATRVAFYHKAYSTPACLKVSGPLGQWCDQNAGVKFKDWCARHSSEYVDYFFTEDGTAMMFKLIASDLASEYEPV